jgi:hypothetical protein
MVIDIKEDGLWRKCAMMLSRMGPEYRRRSFTDGRSLGRILKWKPAERNSIMENRDHPCLSSKDYFVEQDTRRGISESRKSKARNESPKVV